ncbi:ribonuclease H-like protein, partial [Leucogyrophana mollusca]
ILFDPTLTTKSSLEDCFRIFVPNKNTQSQPAWRIQEHQRPNNDENDITQIYTDGSCTNNGKQNAKSGSGIWFGPNDPRNTHIRTPGPNQSNQAGEITAVIVAAQICDPLKQLQILTDSKYVISGLTEYLKTWEDQGWIGTKNQKLFEAAAYQLRRRAAPTTLKWVKG